MLLVKKKRNQFTLVIKKQTIHKAKVLVKIGVNEKQIKANLYGTIVLQWRENITT